VESQADTPEAGDPQALLWALADFRADVERLIEEQKAVVLSLSAPLAPVEPTPAPVRVSYTPPQAADAPAAVSEPDPQPIRKAARAVPKAWPRESPAPQAAYPPTSEPAEAPSHEPARPEDARQRLDALAAKLLDRRLKQTAADPAPGRRDR